MLCKCYVNAVWMLCNTVYNIATIKRALWLANLPWTISRWMHAHVRFSLSSEKGFSFFIVFVSKNSQNVKNKTEKGIHLTKQVTITDHNKLFWRKNLTSANFTRILWLYIKLWIVSRQKFWINCFRKITH